MDTPENIIFSNAESLQISWGEAQGGPNDGEEFFVIKSFFIERRFLFNRRTAELLYAELEEWLYANENETEYPDEES